MIGPFRLSILLAVILVGSLSLSGDGFARSGGDNPQTRPPEDTRPPAAPSASRILSELAQAKALAARVRAQAAALRAKIAASGDGAAAAKAAESASNVIANELRQLRAIAQRLQALAQ